MVNTINELKNRGVEDILIFAIDGLNGFNQAIQAVYPKAEIQRCIVHHSWNFLLHSSLLGNLAYPSHFEAASTFL